MDMDKSTGLMRIIIKEIGKMGSKMDKVKLYL